MILRLILLLLFLFFLYRLFGGKMPSLRKSKEEKRIEENTLVECNTCHTFVTVKESFISNGKYYCSKECLP